MSKDPTIQDALDFIHTYRGDSPVWRGMTDEEIVQDILQSAAENCTAYAIESGKITGIVTGEVNHDYRLLFVHELLCSTPKAMLTLCCIFDHYYHSYGIQACRDGSRSAENLIRYKRTNRLVALLARISARRTIDNILDQQEQLTQI